MLNPCTLSMSVATMGNMIAADLSDEKLAQVASIFSQLGDTLNTICAQRALIAACKQKNSAKEADNSSVKDGADSSATAPTAEPSSNTAP